MGNRTPVVASDYSADNDGPFRAQTASDAIVSLGSITVPAGSAIGTASGAYLRTAVDLSTGLGTASGVDTAYQAPLVFSHSTRTDGANNIVFASAYDRNAASITNAATMRLCSFGWTNNADAFAELAAVMCDGTFISGQQTARVAESATGLVVQLYGTGSAGTATAAAAVTAGLKTVCQVETLSPAAVQTPLTTVIPAGSVIRAVLANCEAELTGGSTTVTWSIGTEADPDKYGTAGYPSAADSLAQNSKSNWVGTTQVVADETISLIGTVTGGATAGDTALTVGSVKIMVIYDTYDAIPDA